MSVDHAEFILKHHRMPAVKKKQKKFRLRDFNFLAGLSLFYILTCLAIAQVFDLDNNSVTGIALAYFVATGGVYVVKRVFRYRSSNEQERDLLLQVLEGSRGARIITDNIDNTVYANSKFEELCVDFGKPSLENFVKLFDKQEETMAHFHALADQAYRGLTNSIELQSHHNHKDVWFQITAQPVDGYKDHVHWRVDDITQHRAVDRAIREEREKLIDFTDNAPVGFFSVDENGRFVFVNATLARWLGSDIQSILSQGHLHAYIEDVPEGLKPYDIIPDGGAKQMGEVVMKGPGGKTFSASISQAVVKEGKTKVRTRGVVHDLTAEREIRKALQVSEDKFQRFFAEAPLGIAILSDKGTLEDTNPSLALMLAYEVEDLEGRQLEDLLHEDDRRDALAILDKMEEGKETSPIEMRLLGKDHEVAVQMYARRLEGSNNVVLHFIDLSEQKALEEQFTQSQKMQAVGQLAGGVAHDFNNLLTAIIGFCDLLLLRHKPGDPSFSDIMQIKQNSNRASNLVRQLLAFSRQQTLRPKVQDITDILSEVSYLLRRLMGANIELEVVHGSDLGLIKVDTGQMEQVLINLAVNARDAMNDAGKLIIETSMFNNKKPMDCGSDKMPAGHWLAIAVKDTGCGIAEDNLSRILEPFFTTKEVGQGTGLGLSTVYGIIRQTGGYLSIESTVGKGTTFTIYLPRLLDSEIEEDDHHEEVQEDTTQDLTGTACILLVEDEDAVRTFSSRALSNKGYEVLEAANGENALEVLDGMGDRIPDLLITDVIMPNMDGPTLASKVRETNPDLKIIFISGYTEEKLKDHMGENIWFLPKPFTLKVLAAKVKEALED